MIHCTADGLLHVLYHLYRGPHCASIVLFFGYETVIMFKDIQAKVPAGTWHIRALVSVSAFYHRQVDRSRSGLPTVTLPVRPAYILPHPAAVKAASHFIQQFGNKPLSRYHRKWFTPVALTETCITQTIVDLCSDAFAFYLSDDLAMASSLPIPSRKPLFCITPTFSSIPVFVCTCPPPK